MSRLLSSQVQEDLCFPKDVIAASPCHHVRTGLSAQVQIGGGSFAAVARPLVLPALVADVSA